MHGPRGKGMKGCTPPRARQSPIFSPLATVLAAATVPPVSPASAATPARAKAHPVEREKVRGEGRHDDAHYDGDGSDGVAAAAARLTAQRVLCGVPAPIHVVFATRCPRSEEMTGVSTMAVCVMKDARMASVNRSATFSMLWEAKFHTCGEKAGAGRGG